jgi:hypothetical protein
LLDRGFLLLMRVSKWRQLQNIAIGTIMQPAKIRINIVGEGKLWIGALTAGFSAACAVWEASKAIATKVSVMPNVIFSFISSVLLS